MAEGFTDIPDVVIDYVRDVFSRANEKVSRAVATHPSMHEETLDHLMVMELTAAPPAFFAAERMGVSIESHWLGSRWMLGRWEIADIAFFILLRMQGRLLARKVALLQTKRLYSKEIDVAEIDEADYRIGIGRLADRTDPTVPLSRQRAFSFDKSCVYAATSAGHPQVERVDQYMATTNIPVYYGLYNPTAVPLTALLYPPVDGVVSLGPNDLGCRVIPAEDVHAVLSTLAEGQRPSFGALSGEQLFDEGDARSAAGWRLERFVADEVLRCRRGRIFDDLQDPRLRALLYEREAPIAAAITITIDFGGRD
jgi:hypothetical protein